MTQIVAKFLKRKSTILFAFLALVGVGYFCTMSPLTITQTGRIEVIDKFSGPSGEAFYAIKDLKKGESIDLSSLEARIIPVNKMPDHIVTSLQELAGCSARFDIAKGQLVSQFDLDPYPPSVARYVVIAIKPIPKGLVIEAGALRLDQWMSNVLWLDDFFQNKSEITGKLAAKDICKGEPIRQQDLLP